MTINLKLNTIKEEKENKMIIWKKKIAYIEKEILEELNQEEMARAYFVNGIHMIDASLCRNVIDMYLKKKDECIVTIHDSFGVSYNQIEEIKINYLKSFFNNNKLLLSKIYLVLKSASYEEIKNKIEDKEIKDIIDIFPEFFMKTETEIRNPNSTNLEFLLQT